MDKVTALRAMATVDWDGMDALGGRRRRLIGTARSQEGPPMRSPVYPLTLAPHQNSHPRGSLRAPISFRVRGGAPLPFGGGPGFFLNFAMA
jgi:hypothetical protein